MAIESLALRVRGGGRFWLSERGLPRHSCEPCQAQRSWRRSPHRRCVRRPSGRCPGDRLYVGVCGWCAQATFLRKPSHTPSKLVILMSSGSLDRGVLLQFRATTSDGVHVHAAWKAHSPSSGSSEQLDTLYWEMRMVAPSLGYLETSKRRLWTIISENWAKWQRCIILAGFDKLAHSGRSKHALTKQVVEVQVAELLAAEQEHWVTTEALMGIMVTLPPFRRSIGDRDRCKAVGCAFFEATLLGDGLEGFCTWGVGDDVRRACRLDPDSTGMCESLRRHISDPSLPAPGTMAPQSSVIRKLCALAETLPCAAASWCRGWRRWPTKGTRLGASTIGTAARGRSCRDSPRSDAWTSM